jgi:hypothetical protein
LEEAMDLSRDRQILELAEMGSGALIYVPSLIKISSGVQKLLGRDTHTHTRTAT